MTVRDLDTDIVHQFLKWLYREKVIPSEPVTRDTDTEQQCYLNVARLFVVADV